MQVRRVWGISEKLFPETGPGPRLPFSRGASIRTLMRWPDKTANLALLLLGLLLLTGCARNYVITMANGRTVTTASKPKLVKGCYVWKDGLGQTQSLPEGRVREIAPASMAKEKQKQFKP